MKAKGSLLIVGLLMLAVLAFAGCTLGGSADTSSNATESEDQANITQSETMLADSSVGEQRATTDRSDLGKVLIAYFSFEGHTKQIAEDIHAQIGGDLFEIVPTEPYTGTRNDLSGIASAELRENARPSVASHVNDMAQYDTVFIGYPCWWGNAPMVVFTFLEEYDFSGKTVAPFSSYGTSGWGDSLESIREAIGSDANLVERFCVQEDNMQNLSSQVASWLQELEA